MKPGSSYLIFLSLFLFFTICLCAQPVQQSWTLQQCIEYALKNNIRVKQQELNTEISKANYLQSKAQVLPNLNGHASHSYNFGRNIDPVTNSFTTSQVLSQNFGLTSSVVLFNGLENYNNIKQN